MGSVTTSDNWLVEVADSGLEEDEEDEEEEEEAECPSEARFRFRLGALLSLAAERRGAVTSWRVLMSPSSLCLGREEHPPQPSRHSRAALAQTPGLNFPLIQIPWPA